MTPRCSVIQQAVAAEFGVTITQLLGARRRQREVIPRQVAMWLCRVRGRWSNAHIARAFGRSAPTVLHDIRVARQRAEQSPNLWGVIEAAAWRLDR